MVLTKSVDHWHRVQNDNVARFIIQGTEKCKGAQTTGFRFKRGSKQITGGQ
jgi:hypothetical protein